MAVTDAVRRVLAAVREELVADGTAEITDDRVLDRVAAELRLRAQPSLRPVLNLTGLQCRPARMINHSGGSRKRSFSNKVAFIIMICYIFIILVIQKSVAFW